MTREDAFAKAIQLYGDRAQIGRNDQYQDAPLFVGVRTHGEFTLFGAGKTWEEAFAAVGPVKDLGGWKFKKL